MAEARDAFAVVANGGETVALWSTAARRPLQLPSGKHYRLDFMETAPTYRGGILGAFTLGIIASRALELGCVGMVLGSLPALVPWYNKAGATAGKIFGWRHPPDLIPYRFSSEALVYLKDLADAHIIED